MTTTKPSINFDGRFAVKGWRGIAFWLVGYATETSWNEEERVDESHVVAVMVGDDKRHTVHVRDLTEISEDDYCSVCGQIGCHHNF
jgi:hypothetical protein